MKSLSKALVIGNGKSRLQFDLYQLRQKYKTYGCNAIYRDFVPDVLVSMDWYMVKEIIDSGVIHKTHFVTQHMNQTTGLEKTLPINFIDTETTTPDSGNAAVKYAIKQGATEVYIIGFDGHIQQYNNVYAGTRNYHHNGYCVKQIQEDKWQHRLYSTMVKNPNVDFYIVNDHMTHTLPNLTYITIEDFKEELNYVGI